MPVICLGGFFLQIVCEEKHRRRSWWKGWGGEAGPACWHPASVEGGGDEWGVSERTGNVVSNLISTTDGPVHALSLTVSLGEECVSLRISPSWSELSMSCAMWARRLSSCNPVCDFNTVFPHVSSCAENSSLSALSLSAAWFKANISPNDHNGILLLFIQECTG